MDISEQVEKLLRAADLVDGVSDGPSRALAVESVREVAEVLQQLDDNEAPKKEQGPQVSEFQKCETCASSSGSPVLCVGCFNNRMVIEQLRSKLMLDAELSRNERNDFKAGLALMRAAQKVEPTLNAFAAAQLAVFVELRALRRELRSAGTPDLTQLVDDFRLRENSVRVYGAAGPSIG